MNLLRQIALRDDPLSQLGYIDLMIQSEEQTRKPGYKSRIEQLHMARKEAEVRAKMLENSFAPWKDQDEAIHSVLVQGACVEEEEAEKGNWQQVGARLRKSAKEYFGMS